MLFVKNQDTIKAIEYNKHYITISQYNKIIETCTDRT